MIVSLVGVNTNNRITICCYKLDKLHFADIFWGITLSVSS